MTTLVFRFSASVRSGGIFRAPTRHRWPIISGYFVQEKRTDAFSLHPQDAKHVGQAAVLPSHPSGPRREFIDRRIGRKEFSQPAIESDGESAKIADRPKLLAFVRYALPSVGLGSAASVARAAFRAGRRWVRLSPGLRDSLLQWSGRTGTQNSPAHYKGFPSGDPPHAADAQVAERDFHFPEVKAMAEATWVARVEYPSNLVMQELVDVKIIRQLLLRLILRQIAKCIWTFRRWYP
jgi:hypothetical protein